MILGTNESRIHPKSANAIDARRMLVFVRIPLDSNRSRFNMLPESYLCWHIQTPNSPAMPTTNNIGNIYISIMYAINLYDSMPSNTHCEWFILLQSSNSTRLHHFYRGRTCGHRTHGHRAKVNWRLLDLQPHEIIKSGRTATCRLENVCRRAYGDFYPSWTAYCRAIAHSLHWYLSCKYCLSLKGRVWKWKWIRSCQKYCIKIFAEWLLIDDIIRLSHFVRSCNNFCTKSENDSLKCN
jgi:hypothetical protein